MTRDNVDDLDADRDGGSPPPPFNRRRRSDDDGHRGGTPLFSTFIVMLLILAVAYGAYFWFVRRVVVPAGHVLVLMKKDGGRTLPGDQVIIPRPPDPKVDPTAHEAWRDRYSDVNGIVEQVHLPGTYFAFSPFDYERQIAKVVEVPSGKVGVVVRRFGGELAFGQVLAGDDQRGPLPLVLQPGQYPQFSNPHAYEVKLVDPVQVDPGHRGVVTIMAGTPSPRPNRYLVDPGEQGTQPRVEPEGFRYINPYEKRVMPISIQSQRFEMTGDDAIRFPSSDSFDIRMEGFVEWSVVPDKLPLIYMQYGQGGDVLPYLEERVILPYSRAFSRLVGSQYTARDFISGDTKLKFQNEFESRLREACEAQGIEILQALVRDIVPPDEIKQPINEREIAKEQIKALEQQIEVARSQAALVRETELQNQFKAIGDANRQVVTTVKRAEQDRNVAVTKARQELEVAKLQLQAAERQAEALVSRGQAEANVVLLQKQAEAEPLRQQVAAFGDGRTFAQFYFYQKVAPSIKTIMTNQEGPLADMFRQFVESPAPTAAAQRQQPQSQPQAQPAQKVTGVSE